LTARSPHLLTVDPHRGVKLTLVAFQTQHTLTLCKATRKVLFHINKSIDLSGFCNLQIVLLVEHMQYFLLL